MKKIFSTIAAFALTMSLASAKLTWGGSSKQPGGMNSGAYTTSDGSVTYKDGVFTFNSNYVWTDFASRIDDQWAKNAGLSVSDITEMGYYSINADGTTGDLTKLYSKDDDQKSSAIFQKGDKIGIYMNIDKKTTTSGHYEKVKNGWKTSYEWVPGETTVENNTYTTTQTDKDGAVKAGTTLDPDSKGAEQYFCLFTNGTVSGSAHYEYYLEGMLSATDEESLEDFTNRVKELIQEENLDVRLPDSQGGYLDGEPLPELLVTLGIGGTALAGFMKRRKKNAKSNN